ncbi:MAG: sulfatase-like hydrolase/transferase [Patescibacteria group bacterium]
MPKKRPLAAKKTKKNNQFKSWFSFWGILFMLATLPVLSTWLKNRYQVTVQDIILPIVLALITTLIVAILFRKNYSENRLAALTSVVLLTLVLNYNYEGRLESISPVINALNPFQSSNAQTNNVITSLIFLVILFALAKLLYYILNRFLAKKKWPEGELTIGIVIVIAVIFIIQAFSVSRAIILEWPQFFYRPPKLAGAPTNPTAKNKPDIYYIVLDRYTNQNILQDQFNFDNSNFTNFLDNNQFYVNENADANYPYTTMSIASTLNANYLSDLVSKFGNAQEQILQPYHDSIRYSSVITALKSLGYSYDELGTWYETTNVAPLADHVYQADRQLNIFNRTITLDEFPEDEFTSSLYYRFILKGLKIGQFNIIGYHIQSELDATTSKLAILNNLANQPSGGRFIFAHILVPHDPYYFNADGSLNSDSGENNGGEQVKQKYINQVEFINSQMKTLVNQINQKSNNQAIIILQSDEGAYPTVFNHQEFNGSSSSEINAGNMLQWSDDDLKMKFGVLAAYHLPGVGQTDLKAAGNSVDIFRLVLDHYFGYNLPYLPECYYAYPNGRVQPFRYENINVQLTGQANSVCPANSDFNSH